MELVQMNGEIRRGQAVVPGKGPQGAPKSWNHHFPCAVLTTFLPLDTAATAAAIRLREASPGRLPLADSLIAGTAYAADLILVHRDPHFDPAPGASMRPRF